ncbi:hypothetical protein [Leptolyngbya ohadii]|uniref:hypothetical protein n=1 Tax=Leptolyngbya ohadii TaxID=1962290 RepID=UPI000B59A7FD|nr:hypothetical protein [Leptolyngbya ohadii]
MNANSSNASASNSSADLLSVRYQFRYKRDLQFALVIKYLERREYVVSELIKELLKVRFTAAALDDEGKLNRSIALDCIGKLKGYIYEIEQLAGLTSNTNDTERAVSGSSGFSRETGGSSGNNNLDDELELRMIALYLSRPR